MRKFTRYNRKTTRRKWRCFRNGLNGWENTKPEAGPEWKHSLLSTRLMAVLLLWENQIRPGGKLDSSYFMWKNQYFKIDRPNLGDKIFPTMRYKVYKCIFKLCVTTSAARSKKKKSFTNLCAVIKTIDGKNF